MKASIFQKLQNLTHRHEELSALLSDAEVIAAPAKFRDYSREYAQLELLVETFHQYEQCKKSQQAAQEMLSDPDMKAMAEEEITVLNLVHEKLEAELYRLLLPRDPDDNANVFVEVRAGTGGDEASIFAGDLARMYMRYAERQGWQIEIMSENVGEHGGYKEIIMRLSGKEVYAQLKFESGAHRVQRVPVTESQGRVHTSACTVAVMPVVEDIEEVEINPSDLRIDTYRASGAGGQHVNKTDSAIRITHIPTGVVVECQDERSQHKNRARAMSLLSAKLLMQEKEKQRATQASTRRELVGSGDRSERIRTYNYPQGRLTDHRINLTLYKLEDILNGDLVSVIEPLVREHQADLLAQMGQE